MRNVLLIILIKPCGARVVWWALFSFQVAPKASKRQCKQQQFNLLDRSALFEEKECWEWMRHTGMHWLHREKTSQWTGWLGDLAKWDFSKTHQIWRCKPRPRGRAADGEGLEGRGLPRVCTHLCFWTACSEGFLKPLDQTCEANCHLQGNIHSQGTSVEVRCNFGLVLYKKDTGILAPE